MQFGVFVPTMADDPEDPGPGFAPNYSSLSWQKTKKYVTELENLGFESIWVPDHLMIGKKETLFDSLTILAALAAVTQTIRLGTVVLSSSFRHPAILAKMISTIDIISDGRLYVGLGSGYYEREFKAFDFPPVDKTRTHEIALLLRKLWEESSLDSPLDHKGKFFSFTQAVSLPKPVQHPIPLYIGGNSDETLQMVVNVANGWITAGSHTACEVNIGRLQALIDTQEIEERLTEFIWFGRVILANEKNSYEKIAPGAIGGTLTEIKEQITALENLGFTRLILAFPDFPRTKSPSIFAKEFLR